MNFLQHLMVNFVLLDRFYTEGLSEVFPIKTVGSGRLITLMTAEVAGCTTKTLS